MQQLPLSSLGPLVDEVAAHPSSTSATTSLAVALRFPHAPNSARVLRLLGWRPPVPSRLFRVIFPLAARFAELSLNMPSTNKHAAPVAAADHSSKKRKMDAAEQKYYAVRAGFKPGVYTSWAICQQQITGFKGAQCPSPLVSPTSSC